MDYAYPALNGIYHFEQFIWIGLSRVFFQILDYSRLND